MKNVLIVSGSEKSSKYINDIFKGFGARCTFASSGGEARRFFSVSQFDFAVINAPLSDEPGYNLAVDIACRGECCVILLVKEDICDAVSAKTEDSGIVVLPKPTTHRMLYSAAKFMDITVRKYSGLQKENVRLQQKLDEMRLVSRAKCVLIQYLNMTEQQAHKYIEKQAMDMRSTKKSIALSILSTYEN